MSVEIYINFSITITLAILAAFLIRGIWTYFLFLIFGTTSAKDGGKALYSKGPNGSDAAILRPTTDDQ